MCLMLLVSSLDSHQIKTMDNYYLQKQLLAKHTEAPEPSSLTRTIRMLLFGTSDRFTDRKLERYCLWLS